MPALQDISTLINTSLSTGNFSTRKFQPAVYYTIADTVKTVTDETEKLEPMIIDDNGECIKMIYNDVNALQVFHLIGDLSYSPATLDYGPPGTTMQEVAEMTLVFVGNRKRLKTRPEDISAAILMNIPKEFDIVTISSLNINSCIIEVSDVETDPYKNFSMLWTNIKSFVKPETVLITIKYKITTTYNRNCWVLCKPTGIYNY